MNVTIGSKSASGLAVFDYWDEIVKGTDPKAFNMKYQWIDASLRRK